MHNKQVKPCQYSNILLACVVFTRITFKIKDQEFQNQISK